MLSFPVGLMNKSSAADPYNANVVLYLKGDGENNSTNIIDSSPNPKTITRFGDTKISTNQSKYGGSSIYFDGNGDYLTAEKTPFNFLHGNTIFTVEFWIYPIVSTAFTPISSGAGTADRGFTVTILNIQKVEVPISRGTFGSYAILPITLESVIVNQWNHIAVIKNLSNYFVSINGIVETFGLGSGQSTSPSTYDLNIGRLISSSGSFQSYNGYLDSLRITEGVARYTANFNPETDTYLAY